MEAADRSVVAGSNKMSRRAQQPIRIVACRTRDILADAPLRRRTLRARERCTCGFCDLVVRGNQSCTAAHDQSVSFERLQSCRQFFAGDSGDGGEDDAIDRGASGGKQREDPQLSLRQRAHSLAQCLTSTQQRTKTGLIDATPLVALEAEHSLIKRVPQCFEHQQRTAACRFVQSRDERGTPLRIEWNETKRRNQGAYLWFRQCGEREQPALLRVWHALGTRRGEAENMSTVESTPDSFQHAKRWPVDPVQVVNRQHEALLIGDRMHQIRECQYSTAERVLTGGTIRCAGESRRQRGSKCQQRRHGGRRDSRRSGQLADRCGKIPGERVRQVAVPGPAAQLHDNGASGLQSRHRIAKKSGFPKSRRRAEV